MTSSKNLLDREMTMRLLCQGVFLSSQVLPITKAEALVLLAEAKLDSFMKEFKGLVRELLCGCQLRDFQATPEEIEAWFGEGQARVKPEEPAATAAGSLGAGSTPSYPTMSKGVIQNG